MRPVARRPSFFSRSFAAYPFCNLGQVIWFCSFFLLCSFFFYYYYYFPQAHSDWKGKSFLLSALYRKDQRLNQMAQTLLQYSNALCLCGYNLGIWITLWVCAVTALKDACESTDGGQLHKLPVAMEFPPHLCLEVISSAGEVIMHGWCGGTGASFRDPMPCTIHS